MRPHRGIILIGQPQAHIRVVNEPRFARSCSSGTEAATVAPNAWRGKP